MLVGAAERGVERVERVKQGVELRVEGATDRVRLGQRGDRRADGGASSCRHEAGGGHRDSSPEQQRPTYLQFRSHLEMKREMLPGIVMTGCRTCNDAPRDGDRATLRAWVARREGAGRCVAPAG